MRWSASSFRSPLSLNSELPRDEEGDEEHQQKEVLDLGLLVLQGKGEEVRQPNETLAPYQDIHGPGDQKQHPSDNPQVVAAPQSAHFGFPHFVVSFSSPSTKRKALWLPTGAAGLVDIFPRCGSTEDPGQRALAPLYGLDLKRRGQP